MARMNGRSRFPIDAELILRNAGQAAITVDTDLAVQAFAQKGALWQNPADPRNGQLYLVGNVESLAGAGATLSVDLYVADDVAKTNPVLVASYPVVVGAWFELPIDEFSWLRQFPSKSHWFARLNITGSGASAGVFAYLAPCFDE